MLVPYETMVSSFEAQNDIKEFLEFLGASDVLCTFDQKMQCSVQWIRNGNVGNLEVSAQSFVDMWMHQQPWKRRPVVSPFLGEQQEIEYAVISFWYVMRDYVFTEAPTIIFTQERMIKISEQQTHLLVKRMTLGSSA